MCGEFDEALQGGVAATKLVCYTSRLGRSTRVPRPWMVQSELYTIAVVLVRYAV